MSQPAHYRPCLATDTGLNGLSDYLERTSRNAVLHIASLIGSATSGRRGKYATIALNMAGVTSNEQAISRLYEQHDDVIDAYFEHVDIVKLAKKLDLDQTVARRTSAAILKTGGLLAGGILLGMAALTLYNKTNRT